MKHFAVAKTWHNGSPDLEILTDKEFGNFSGYDVLFESDNLIDCQNFIKKNTVEGAISTIVIAPGENEIVWQRQENGIWQNMTKHSWAINYGSDEDEEYRNDYEMKNEVEFRILCGYTVESF